MKVESFRSILVGLFEPAEGLDLNVKSDSFDIEDVTGIYSIDEIVAVAFGHPNIEVAERVKDAEAGTIWWRYRPRAVIEGERRALSLRRLQGFMRTRQLPPPSFEGRTESLAITGIVGWIEEVFSPAGSAKTGLLMWTPDEIIEVCFAHAPIHIAGAAATALSAKGTYWEPLRSNQGQQPIGAEASAPRGAGSSGASSEPAIIDAGEVFRLSQESRSAVPENLDAAVEELHRRVQELERRLAEGPPLSSAIDAPGIGHNQPPPEPLTAAEMERLREVVSRLGRTTVQRSTLDRLRDEARSLAEYAAKMLRWLTDFVEASRPVVRKVWDVVEKIAAIGGLIGFIQLFL